MPSELASHDTSRQTQFVRQRRNLLVVSFLLLAFLSTGAELSHLNVFGNQIDLRRPLLVSWPLWIAWAYLLWRYYQHLHDLGNLGIRDAFVGRVYHLVGLEARRQVHRKFHPGPPYTDAVKCTFTRGSADVVHYRPDGWYVRVGDQVEFVEGSRSGRQPLEEVVPIPIRAIRLSDTIAAT